MTTTGTYSYGDTCANLTMTAFGRIGFKPTELTAQHLAVAATEANLTQVSLANREPNLFKGQTWFRTLTAGQGASHHVVYQWFPSQYRRQPRYLYRFGHLRCPRVDYWNRNLLR
jgi:hypothetical protein